MPSIPPDSTRTFDADWGSLDSERSPGGEPRPPSARWPPSARGAIPPPAPGPPSLPPLAEEEYQRDTMPPPVPLSEFVEQMMRQADSDDSGDPPASGPGQPDDFDEVDEIGRSSDELTRPFNSSDIPAFFEEIGVDPPRFGQKEKVVLPPSPYGLAAEHELLHAGASDAAMADPRFYALDAVEQPPPSFARPPLGLVASEPQPAGESRKVQTAPFPFARAPSPDSEPPGVLRRPPIGAAYGASSFGDDLDELRLDDLDDASDQIPGILAPPPARGPAPSPPPVSAPFGATSTAPYPPFSPMPEVDPSRSMTPSSYPLARIRVTPSPGSAPPRSLTPLPPSRPFSRSSTPVPGSYRPATYTPPPSSSPPLSPSSLPPRSAPAGLRLGPSLSAARMPSVRPLEAVPAPVGPDPILRMQKRIDAGDYGGAMMIAEDLLATDPGNVHARDCVESCRAMLTQKYLSRLGSKVHVAHVAVPPDELRWLSLDHRAGFLLSFIDGAMSIEEVLDVACMPELDALRILYELREQGVIDILAPAARSSRR